MKRRIQKILCDTETATKLASASHLAADDPAYCTEELFRTKSGKYFLYCRGGPESRYATRNKTGELTAGADLQLLTREAARVWAESNLGRENGVALFDHPDKSSLSKIAFVPTPEARARLEEIRDQTGMTFSDILSAAVVEYHAR